MHCIFYISDYTFETIIDVLSQPVPKLFGIYSRTTFHLMTLFVPESLRNNKRATTLISTLFDYCVDHRIKFIEVDDMSDHFNQPNNVYLKCGFKYEKPNFPEMQTTPHRIIYNLYPVKYIIE